MRWWFDNDPYRPRLRRWFAWHPVAFYKSDHKAWLERVWRVSGYVDSYGGGMWAHEYFRIEDEGCARENLATWERLRALGA